MNVNQIVDKLFASGVGGGIAGGLASGLLVSSLTTKKGRKIAGSAAKLGGAALIGGVAWKAYDNYRQKQNRPESNGDTPSRNSPTVQHSPTSSLTHLSNRDRGQLAWDDIPHEEFEPTQADKTDQRDLLILRAMMAAAHSDGHMDSAERARIYRQIESMDVNSHQKAKLIDEFLQPLSINGLVAQVPNQAIATEVYLASLLTIDTSSRASAEYLDELAYLLDIPEDLRLSLHAEVSATTDETHGLQDQQTRPEPAHPIRFG